MTRSAQEPQFDQRPLLCYTEHVSPEWRNWERAAVFSYMNEAPSLSSDR